MRPLAAALLGLSLLSVAATAAEPEKPFLPNLFDPGHHLPKPDLAAVKTIRFLTTDDFPPFHLALADGSLAGFDIDLARAICEDLKIACTIQARRFDTLVAALGREGDALVAAIADTPATRATLSFSAPYLTTPARFVVPAASTLDAVTPAALASHTVGVQAGTAHLAYLQAFYPGARLVTFADQAALHAALRGGTVEAAFGDGISLALWLNGTDAQGCCAFKGGPYTESRFFGNGIAIAVTKENVALRQVLDYELAKLARDGVYADLYLKYFPVGLY